MLARIVFNPKPNLIHHRQLRLLPNMPNQPHSPRQHPDPPAKTPGDAHFGEDGAHRAGGVAGHFFARGGFGGAGDFLDEFDVGAGEAGFFCEGEEAGGAGVDWFVDWVCGFG